MWSNIGEWFGGAGDWLAGAGKSVLGAGTGVLTGIADMSQYISKEVGSAYEDLAGSTAATAQEQRETATNILGMSTPSLILVAALLITVSVVATGR